MQIQIEKGTIEPIGSGDSSECFPDPTNRPHHFGPGFLEIST